MRGRPVPACPALGTESHPPSVGILTAGHIRSRACADAEPHPINGFATRRLTGASVAVSRFAHCLRFRTLTANFLRPFQPRVQLGGEAPAARPIRSRRLLEWPVAAVFHFIESRSRQRIQRREAANALRSESWMGNSRWVQQRSTRAKQMLHLQAAQLGSDWHRCESEFADTFQKRMMKSLTCSFERTNGPNARYISKHI